MTTTDRRYGVAEGLAVKAPCRIATTESTNISLTGLQTIGGVTLADGDRVLVWGQTDATENGIYNASSGNWSRAADFDGVRDVVQGTRVLVAAGTYADQEFYLTTANPVIGTSNLTFTRFNSLTQAMIDEIADLMDAATASGGWVPASQAEAEADDPINTRGMSPLRTRQAISLRVGVVSPEDYGAVGDGVTDDYGFLQQCFDDALTNHREVQFKGKTYATSATIELNNPVNDRAPGPRWRGVPNSTTIKPTGGFAGPLISVRGVPAAGTTPGTTYFWGGGFDNIILSGVDGAASNFHLLQMIGWCGGVFNEVHFRDASGDGVKSKVDTAYSASVDLSANQSCVFNHCWFERLLGYAYHDADAMSSPSTTFNLCQTSLCYTGGYLLRSTFQRVIGGGVAYSGLKPDGLGGYTANSSALGIQIGATADDPVQGVVIDSVECDENLTSQISIVKARGTELKGIRTIYGDALGTACPASQIILSPGGAEVVGTRGSGFYCRFDTTGAVTMFANGGTSDVKDNHFTGVTISNGGGATVTNHSGFVGSGLNRSLNNSIGLSTGEKILFGRYDTISGTATFSASTTVGVTFAADEPDTAYGVYLDAFADENFWITSKTTSGFIINTGTVTSSAIEWSVYRRN